MKILLIIATVAMIIIITRIGINSTKEPIDEQGVAHYRKHLFSYHCTSPTFCTVEANVYVVNYKGINVEPGSRFVQECLEDRRAGRILSNTCRNMREPGYTEVLRGSAEVVEYMIDNDSNPEEDESVERRRAEAMEVLGSLR